MTLGNWVETRVTSGEAVLTTVVDPGASMTLPFLVPVATPGLYFVKVKVPASPDKTADAADHLTKPGDEASWSAYTFVSVTDKVGPTGGL